MIKTEGEPSAVRAPRAVGECPVRGMRMMARNGSVVLAAAKTVSTVAMASRLALPDPHPPCMRPMGTTGGRGIAAAPRPHHAAGTGVSLRVFHSE